MKRWQTMHLATAAMFLAAVSFPLCGFAQPARRSAACWVLTKSGRRIPGAALTALPDGTLRLQLKAGGPIETFKPGTYRAAYIPKPRQVTQLEALLARKQYADVVKYGPALFAGYKFLGWGDSIAALHARALLAQGKAEDAVKVLDEARPWAWFHGDELFKTRIQALLELKKFDEVMKSAEALSKSDRPDAAAFAFNVRGRILEAKGRKREAVLEYLKTVLLFRPGRVDRERKEAKERVVALLKDMKDPRWKEFEKMR